MLSLQGLFFAVVAGARFFCCQSLRSPARFVLLSLPGCGWIYFCLPLIVVCLAASLGGGGGFAVFPWQTSIIFALQLIGKPLFSSYFSCRNLYFLYTGLGKHVFSRHFMRQTTLISQFVICLCLIDFQRKTCNFPYFHRI